MDTGIYTQKKNRGDVSSEVKLFCPHFSVLFLTDRKVGENIVFLQLKQPPSAKNIHSDEKKSGNLKIDFASEFVGGFFSQINCYFWI